MKIHLISDIHFEMDKKLRLTAPDEADVIVLAGDIAEGVDGVGWAQKCYGTQKPIIYISGNHEFYNNDLSVTKEITAAASGTNIHFLDNESIVIDGVRFIGSTLWTSFNNWSNLRAINFLHTKMSDYKLISAKEFYKNNELVERARAIAPTMIKPNGGGSLIVPVITYMLHLKAVKYLEAELTKSHSGKTIVVTHHAPSYKSVLPSAEKLEDAYASSLDDLIEKHRKIIDGWFHGHLHVPVNYEISGVPIVSNPRDYPVFAWDESVKDFIFEV
jgi:predicted phosphodiesterase